MSSLGYHSFPGTDSSTSATSDSVEQGSRQSTAVNDFWPQFLREEKRNWDQTCDSHLRFEQAAPERVQLEAAYTSASAARLPLLSNSKTTNEIYSFFRAIEPDICVSEMTNKLVKNISINEACEHATKINMASDRTLLCDEVLSNADSNYILFVAMLCTRPLLTHPQVSRISRASTSGSFMHQRYSGSLTLSYMRSTFDSRSRQASLAEESVVSVSDGDDVSFRQRRGTVESSARPLGVRCDPRDEQVNFETLLDYVRCVFQGSSTTTDVQPIAGSTWTILPNATEVSNAVHFEEVRKLYFPYACEKTEHKRLLLRLAVAQQLQLTSQEADDADRVDLLAPETVSRLQGMLEENLRVLNPVQQSEICILERRFEDAFVRALSIARSKRLYFHLLCNFVAFELARWHDDARASPSFASLTHADLFDVSPRADGAIILQECRARLLVLSDFHQAAYLGALVKCYALTNRTFYFDHATAAIDAFLRLGDTALPPVGSLERLLVTNACSTLVNEMLADLRYYLNRFASTFANETNCAAWLRLFNAASRLRALLLGAKRCDPRREILTALKEYCVDRLLRLKETLARALGELNTPVAVSFARALVIRAEIARLVHHGISRAFESTCRISLAQRLVHMYFFELLNYANAILSRCRFLSNNSDGNTRTSDSNDDVVQRSCFELLAFVYLLKQLETRDWSALLSSTDCYADADAAELAACADTYRAFGANVSALWRASLALIVRNVDRLQTVALLRETFTDPLRSPRTDDDSQSTITIIDSMHCTGSLLDCLVLLVRFTHVYFFSVSKLFTDPPASLVIRTSTSPNTIALVKPASPSSSAALPDPSSMTFFNLEDCDTQSTAACSSRIRVQYYRHAVYSLLLPFAYSCVFSEFYDQPTSHLSITFFEQSGDALWNHFLAQCVARYGRLCRLLERQLTVNLPLNNTTYCRFLSAMKYARVNVLMHLDPSVEADKDFLLKFTRSLSGRLNDLRVISELVQNGHLADLVNQCIQSPVIDAKGHDAQPNSLRCVTCMQQHQPDASATGDFGTDTDAWLGLDLLRDEDSAQRLGRPIEGECGNCFSSRYLQATIAYAADKLIHSCCSLIVAHCCKTYADIFSCTSAQFSKVLSKSRPSSTQLDATRLAPHTQVKGSLPAVSFLNELNSFCGAELLPPNAQAIMSEVLTYAAVRLCRRYEAFLNAFTNTNSPQSRMTPADERTHAAYLRLNAECVLMLTYSSEQSPVIGDKTRQQLKRLLFRLKLHSLTTEQLLFVWCILEEEKTLPSLHSSLFSEEVLTERLDKIDFSKWLSTLFGLQYYGYCDLARRFCAAKHDASLKELASCAYTEHASGNTCSLDALLVIWLRHCYQQDDALCYTIYAKAQTHRLAEAKRYCESLQRGDDVEIVNDRLIALINRLLTPALLQDELAMCIDRKVRNNR